ncbi:helix-turn-helix domain-containing protein [Streptomyces sp. NPDC096012]|uniref:PucR family transcriptional regulator n=1 Tax=Streptomyces sp. NPDC096012 TaxID=3155684 RepID=UPI00336A0027
MDHRLTARRLVAETGPTLLRVAVDGPGADRPLTGVVIYDPAAGAELEPGCVVLGVGLSPGGPRSPGRPGAAAGDTGSAGPGVAGAGRGGDHADAAALARAMEAAGAAVLALKGPVPDGLQGGPVAVLEVNPDASWMHVASMIRERLLDHSRDGRRSPDGAGGDLFTIANTIAEMLQAPVTIEDRSAAVLAWSTGQRGADEARVESILGRAVHHRWLDQLRARGDFARLHASGGTVHIEPVAPGMLPRAALAVRAGAEVVGYVWAAVPRPLPDDLARRLEQLAPLVALHLVNTRATSSWARQQRAELAAAVLAGGSAGADAARQLHLDTGPLCVLAAAPPLAGPGERSPGADAAAAAERRRFEDVLALHLAAVHPSAVTVCGNDAVYALLAWPRSGPSQALDGTRALARDFLSRSPLAGGHVVAVGGPAESVGRVTRARAQADAALRAMRHPAASGGPSVATLEDVALTAMLLELADATEALALPDATGPLLRLAEHDGEQGVLTETLAAYLASAGVAEDAAALLRIHVNTLRYRLRRIREVGELDFGDADAVLLAHLQLRLRAVRAAALDAGDKRPPGTSS